MKIPLIIVAQFFRQVFAFLVVGNRGDFLLFPFILQSDIYLRSIFQLNLYLSLRLFCQFTWSRFFLNCCCLHLYKFVCIGTIFPPTKKWKNERLLDFTQIQIHSDFSSFFCPLFLTMEHISALLLFLSSLLSPSLFLPFNDFIHFHTFLHTHAHTVSIFQPKNKVK